jgi:hypothetical protein
MIVNMYVDHMSTTRPQTAEDVWNDTHVHSRIYTDAAKKLGLTPKEYEEFRNALLDGKAIYVHLPKRLDGMAGYRNGEVYVVRRAVITTPNIMGWEVNLADGARIYVPQVCGNLSVLRVPVVAHHVVPKPKHVYTVARRVAPPAPAATPPETQVAIQPPAEVAPVPLAPVAAAVTHSQPWWLLLVPLPWLFNGGGNSPPPCSQGSNGQGVCQKT